MIVFDLDGTLADCEHRRHFVKEPPIWETNEGEFNPMIFNLNADKWRKWKPDWKAFHEACDKDIPIQPVIEFWNIQISQGMMGIHQIWSGRCESVRKKTENWLNENLLCFQSNQLKMRPLGNSTPDEELKENWLDEAISEGKTIDFVFDDRPKVVRMWRRRRIFVFNCAQHDEEF